MPQIAESHSDVSTCVLCGSHEGRNVHHGVRYAPDVLVRRCASCNLVFLWPRPTEDRLASYYEGEYRAEYDGAVSPETTYRRVVAEARTRVGRLTPHLTAETRLLELGASCGAFLEAVRPFVGSVTGVEPGKEHRVWGASRLGLEMFANVADVTGRRFDVIVLFHTLEHIADPITFLQILAVHLALGGKIVIEVPNVDDALLTLYRIPSFAPFYYQRGHLYYFSSDTLRRTIAAAGGTGEVIGVQRYDLANHIRWMLTGEPGGHGFYGSVFSEGLDVAYRESLVRAGYADTLWAVAAFPAVGPSPQEKSIGG